MPRACPPAEVTSDVAEAPPAKRARTTSGKPRCPARPYRRVETAVMEARIADYKKKMDVLVSKTTLLRQRLDMHNLEMEMRAADTPADETAAANGAQGA